MFQIELTSRWHELFPGAHVGLLCIGNVDNTRHATLLDERKRTVEAGLREKFGQLSRADLHELAILKAYRNYYKTFNKTYHVQLQLESIVHKSKSLPHVTPLVDANFVVEVETLVLTAGHDADLLEAPILIDATQTGQTFIQMNGSERSLKPNDMMMADNQGVVCTIIYGQDQRTPISPQTRRAFYVAYAPTGVSKAAVQQQLDGIRANVLSFAPKAQVELMEIHTARGANGDSHA